MRVIENVAGVRPRERDDYTTFYSAESIECEQVPVGRVYKLLRRRGVLRRQGEAGKLTRGHRKAGRPATQRV